MSNFTLMQAYTTLYIIIYIKFCTYIWCNKPLDIDPDVPKYAGDAITVVGYSQNSIRRWL